jgi:hypothetical protein
MMLIKPEVSVKELSCAIFLAGSVGVGGMLACRPSACERLDEVCARPSNLKIVMQCGIADMLLLSDRTEAQCEAILDEMAKSE